MRLFRGGRKGYLYSTFVILKSLGMLAKLDFKCNKSEYESIKQGKLTNLAYFEHDCFKKRSVFDKAVDRKFIRLIKRKPLIMF